jgi:hypothetical protein
LEILHSLMAKGYSEQAAQWFLDTFVLTAEYRLNSVDAKYLREHLTMISGYLNELPDGTLQGNEVRWHAILGTVGQLTDMWQSLGVGVGDHAMAVKTVQALDNIIDGKARITWVVRPGLLKRPQLTRVTFYDGERVSELEITNTRGNWGSARVNFRLEFPSTKWIWTAIISKERIPSYSSLAITYHEEKQQLDSSFIMLLREIKANGRFVVNSNAAMVGQANSPVTPKGPYKQTIKTPSQLLHPGVKVVPRPSFHLPPIFRRSVLQGNKDHAMNIPGGIDLNTVNMGMTVTKDANGGVQVNFDPAMIARIRQEGVQSAVPVIINVTPMSSAQIRPLLGL